jgi:hypothetical protein
VRKALLLASALLLLAPALQVGRAAAQTARDTVTSPRPRRWSFGVGERLDYDVRFGGVRVGAGYIEVDGFQEVRGRDVYHTVFRVHGGTLFFKVDDRFDSWIDASIFASVRFKQDQNEGGRDRERLYEIFPDRAIYTDETGKEFPSVSEPLDEGSFLYFVRSVPLEVGREYEFNRYFKPDRNPVRIKVLRRERVKVPAGTFDAVVLQPVIKTRGLFSEDGHAEVWISDDPRRLLLQMRTRFAGFRLSLHLTGYRPPPGAQPASAPSRGRH